MKRVRNDLEIILASLNAASSINPTEAASLNKMVLIDIGCGTGKLVRELALNGATATGMDIETMVAKAKLEPRVANENYLVGQGQKLPFKNKCWHTL